MNRRALLQTLAARAALLAIVLSLATMCLAAEEPPRELVSVLAGGPALIGVIDQVSVASSSDPQESGMVLIHVDEFLRTTGLSPNCASQCRVPYSFPRDQSQAEMLRESGWNRVHPAKGMRVLLILSRTEQPTAEAVLDLKSEQQFVPAVRLAIHLQENVNGGDVSQAFQELANPSDFIRLVALESLKSSCEPGSANRKKLFAAVENQALHGTQAERKEALNWLDEELYDERTANNENNNEVLRFLLTLTKDQDPDVSMLAIRLLYYRVISSNKPDLRTVALNNRSTIESGLRARVADLKKSGGENDRPADMAQRVADELGQK